MENSEDSQFYASSTVGGRYDTLCRAAMPISMAGSAMETPNLEGTTMRRQMRRFMLAAAVFGLMSGAAAPARADIITTFTAEGTFVDGATLGGTLTIDTTIGMVTAANLMVGAPYSLTLATVQNQTDPPPPPTYYFVTVGATAAGFPYIDLIFPVSSLVAYAGGELLSTTTFGQPGVGGGGYSALYTLIGTTPQVDDLSTGSLSVAVPEPNTLLVACMGGVCAIAYGVAKKRRAARTNTRAA